MSLLSAVDVERIHRQTDELELHRDWVVVPLTCAKTGMEMEMVLPDGRILIRPPGRDTFDRWLQDLKVRLAEIGLSRIPRRSVDDPYRHLTGTNGPHSRGTRGYLNRPADLNVLDGAPLPTSGN
ncbi:MAG TPA: hypothetical protein VJB14_09600 [Planctomycetota bacterium]|nr:hypothetical protein [Planctomycetota bacterium]